LSTVQCILWDMNFVLGKIGGQNIVCYGVVVLLLVMTVDCRLSNAYYETWTSFR
jgi:hypothetical protein